MDYASLQRRAQSSIHRNGGAITWVRTIRQGYTPGTGATDRAPTRADIYAVIAAGNPDESTVAGTYELTHHRLLTIAGLDLPDGLNKNTDTFEFAGSTWAIDDYQHYAPDGVTVIYYEIKVHR